MAQVPRRVKSIVGTHRIFFLMNSAKAKERKAKHDVLFTDSRAHTHAYTQTQRRSHCLDFRASDFQGGFVHDMEDLSRSSFAQQTKSSRRKMEINNDCV